MLERLPDDGCRRELIRGELIEMSPVSPQHGRVVGRLSARVVDYALDHDLGEVYVGDTGWRLEYAPDTVLAPDIAFVRKARVADVNEVGFAKTFPDLAIEVLSPSNTAAEMILKLKIYSSSGVSTVWIIEPTRQVAEMHRKGQPVIRLGLDDSLEEPELLPGFSLKLRDLFQRSQGLTAGLS